LQDARAYRRPNRNARQVYPYANWDWDRFPVKGHIEVKPLSDFASARADGGIAGSPGGKNGQSAATRRGSDFEFVTKVEIEKVNDKFSTAGARPFVLSQGLREGPQERLDIQVIPSIWMPGQYKLLTHQVDGKEHPVSLKNSCHRLHTSANLPVVLNQGISTVEFNLKESGWIC